MHAHLNIVHAFGGCRAGSELDVHLSSILLQPIYICESAIHLQPFPGPCKQGLVSMQAGTMSVCKVVESWELMASA